MHFSAVLAGLLLELLYPERCCLCDAGRGEKPWAPAGTAIRGMRFWDVPHLCLPCWGNLEAAPVEGAVGEGQSGRLRVFAACHTHPDLVKLVGGLKYHGLRGLAWPLAAHLSGALDLAGSREPVDALVPVPLSRRRRRARGFNQTEILARLLAADSGLPVRDDLLVRHRDTGQQAKIDSPEMRRLNLVDSFRARRATAEPRRLGLVDDLVTSGWTTVTAAAALRAAGWRVSWVLTLGLAAESRNSSSRVDTPQGGF